MLVRECVARTPGVLACATAKAFSPLADPIPFSHHSAPCVHTDSVACVHPPTKLSHHMRRAHDANLRKCPEISEQNTHDELSGR